MQFGCTLAEKDWHPLGVSYEFHFDELSIADVLHIAVILGSSSVRFTLTNFARSVIYTTAPSFPTVAAIRAGYNLLKSGATKKVRNSAMVPDEILIRTASRSNPASREALLHRHQS